MELSINAINFAYLISVVLFIFGLKFMSSPASARKGNAMAALGMILAIAVTLFDQQILDYTYIIAGLALGTLIGLYLSKVVKMTEMPQMVAVLIGCGGAASTLVTLAEFVRMTELPSLDISLTVVLGILTGTIAFTGSIIAYGKLQGIMKSTPVSFPLQQQVNFTILVVSIGISIAFILNPTSLNQLIALTVLSGLIGILYVIPIGGADMPAVLSMLNAFTGLAASMTGFVLSNYVLIVSGALIGASGVILTGLMCKAMNRSVFNVLFAKVGSDLGASGVEQRKVIGYTPQDVVMMFEQANSVIIIPGYGLAVAQAQHALHEMTSLLEKRGIKVRYAIHPVAGRMPGHMNILLAEVNVPYDQLYEMDRINDDFEETDIAFVVGANDVINPAARYKKDSPLYGMPILNADKAKTVMVLKRSLKPGFAGEDNEIFYNPKTMMVFGDAKDTLVKIVNALKESH